MKNIIDFYESHHLMFFIISLLILVYFIFLSIRLNNLKINQVSNNSIKSETLDDSDKFEICKNKEEKKETYVLIGSKLKLFYILEKKTISVIISESLNRANSNNLFYKLPLGQALISKKVNDIVKFKKNEKDNEFVYVEILEVDNSSIDQILDVSSILNDNDNITPTYVKPKSKLTSEYYYETSRLTFKKNVIEPLNDNDRFTIYVSNSNESFTMTKAEFYNTFGNVVVSDSYRINGKYSYTVTPKKIYQYLSSNMANTPKDAKKNVKLKKTIEIEKIGKYVQKKIKQLWDEGLLDLEELERLQSPKYSKSTFNGNFEILRKSSYGRKDDLGYLRYYKDEIIPGHLLSSQWYNYQKEMFDRWVIKIKNK